MQRNDAYEAPPSPFSPTRVSRPVPVPFMGLNIELENCMHHLTLCVVYQPNLGLQNHTAPSKTTRHVIFHQ